MGSDIAFAAGEYQPGSLVGDALIAHELAHVTQQLAASAPRSIPDLEADADRSAVGAMMSRWSEPSGGSIDGVMPRLRAGLRLQRCAGTAVQQRPAAPPAQSCVALTPDQWREAVTAAGALPAEQRSVAMTQIAQQAMCEIGIAVRAAGTAHPNAVHPDDYAEVPVVNFDVRLNSKTRWRGPRQVGPPMGSNAGYNFIDGSRQFAIIGPNSLNPNTPLTTRQVAQHELYLVSLPQPAGHTSDDLELQAWTEDFRNYFHQYLALPIPQRPNWQRLIGYYEQATQDDVRTQALRRLVDYYNNPPGPTDEVDRVRRQFRSWMRRVDGRLITDLNAALPRSSP